MAKLKPTLSDILGTKLTSFRILKGGKVKLEDGSEAPKVRVEGLDQKDAITYEKIFQYGFIGKDAIDSVERHAEFTEDKGIHVDLPYPTKLEEARINWVNSAF